ncbi:MAG: peptidase S16 [Rhodospirillaceae bacterium]|nr:MAG: peptidase S16 [Rhodospirillaceae bacterium]
MTSVRAPLQLPSTIALFPLNGVVLLPRGHVPLNVYEPRYINLIDDMLGQDRLIGIIQPRAVCTDPIPNDEPLYSVGTIGRIVQFSDPGDGRYHITIEGISRFRLLDTALSDDPIDQSRGYRMATVDFSEFQDDMNSTNDIDGPHKDRVVKLMQNYFNAKEIEADWEAIAEAPYEALVSSLAMTCPFEPTERQALLECNTHQDRANMLISLFEMHGNEGSSPPTVKH